MKRIFNQNIHLIALVIIIAIVSLMLVGCSPFYEEGLDRIDNCRVHDSLEILRDLVYNDTLFLEEFDYTDGNFHFVSSTFGDNKVLLYLAYDLETYVAAKEAMIENTNIDETMIYTFNGYVFYENLELPISHDNIENGHNTMPFRWFNLVGYNDEQQTVFFLGAYYGSSKQKINTQEEFIDFIIDDFSEWYSFK